jgi:hypothetical protein
MKCDIAEEEIGTHDGSPSGWPAAYAEDKSEYYRLPHD